MSDHETSPRIARQLRNFGRSQPPGDVADRRAHEGSDEAPPAERSTTRKAGPLSPGSIWGPQTTAPAATEAPAATVEASSAPTPAPPDVEAPEANTPDPNAPNPKHRRRAGERPPDPESVNIDAEDSHAWWAQREELDRLVKPKKRGAAARAQRSAREAFAPAGADHFAHNPYAQGKTHNYSWDPSEVYSWGPQGAPTDQDHARRSSATPPVREQTPWDALGLTSEATWADVLKRHRQLAKQHHPDRHSNQGAETRAVAEERMAEINAAVADLRKIYRLTDGI